ncbi:hypothetical protein Fcan01_15634 [Folsomia candida]|uniref:Gustatory receptor n=1 Tax=Folsomia candida TaxID=158441 RepID=A0A226DY66_FOLCA|nr:hypothetical protein Fcan01_15634 [Folsomia candida]
MKKKSLSKSIPLLSTQLMETYSATFDTSFFEQHPIAWNAKTERFIIYRATSCKLYWFNVVFVLMIINGGFTVIILTKEVISDLNSAWIRICFPLLGCVMGALFSFVLNISYNALEATNLVDNLIRLERRILHDSSSDIKESTPRYNNLILTLKLQGRMFTPLGFVIAGLGVYFNMCPHGFLLEQWHGPYLMNHDWIRWIARFLSYVAMVIASVEHGQMTSIFTAILTTIVFSWERIANLTSQFPIQSAAQFENVVRNYRQLHLTEKIGRDFVMQVVFGTLSTISTVLSGFIYITIKLYGKMPMKVYPLAPYICFVTLFLTYFLLRGIEGVNNRCAKGLASLKMCRTRRSLEKRVATSVPVFAIPCGMRGYEMFKIEDGYRLGFYAMVLDNTWNLLLSFPNV